MHVDVPAILECLKISKKKIFKNLKKENIQKFLNLKERIFKNLKREKEEFLQILIPEGSSVYGPAQQIIADEVIESLKHSKTKKATRT